MSDAQTPPAASCAERGNAVTQEHLGLPRTTSSICQGAHDAASGQPCGWANGAHDGCPVPDCTFPSERCLLVQRERRGEQIRVTYPVKQ